ncbi:MAG: Coenzyme F420 hydrogenase/dehydrogenase, beta subunit C-terminal domain, partial [Anaerolineae bacterium]|nr:Coenzyme F420 hydrogenase/dehydrogenase, beta subunit C-terminal domain [Anaerolineae bacterium]
QGQSQPWQAEPIIARTREDIIAASQSVYVPVPVNTLLPDMADFAGRLAYVGLPDQVAGLRYLQQAGHPGAQKVDFVLGPYVGTIMYFDAIKSFLRSNGVRDLHDVTELRYREGEWPGYLQITLRSGRVLRAEKFYYNYLIPFYITRSTLLAVDFTNELTDLSVGDAWHPDYEAQGAGFSVVAARTPQAEDLLHEMHHAGVISLEPTTLERALSMHGHMLDFKKRGAFIRLGWRKAAGQPVPDYGYRAVDIPPLRYLVESIILSIFLIAGTPLARRVVEYIPLRILGPLFNTLRQRWKALSKPAKRKGLQTMSFEITPPSDPEKTTMPALVRVAHTLKHIIRTTFEELRHWARSTWTFADVGAHWDATEDYDAINEETYSYFRRFVDGYRLSNLPDNAHILDFCARTGNGTLYFYERGKVGAAVCADVSEFQGNICQQRLREGGFTNFEWVKVSDYTLPFEDAQFDAVLNFETVEHFPEPALMVAELGRVTKPGGTLILTTPNVLWEPVHALAAITGAHHSEGPHRFIRYPRLVAMVERAGFTIEAAETTVLIPGGPAWLVKVGDWIEEHTRHTLMPYLGLRRVLVCRKQ